MYRPDTMPSPNRILAGIKWSIAGALSAVCIVICMQFIVPIVSDAVVTIRTGKLLAESEFKDYITCNLVTPLESEGYAWIRENTDEDSILISNITVFEHAPIITNVFTERRMLVESTANPSVGREEADVRLNYIRGFMLGNPITYPYMIEHGVDYAVILTRYKRGTELVQDADCVYSNEDIEIYRLQ